jgi:hypothetical protein
VRKNDALFYEKIRQRVFLPENLGKKLMSAGDLLWHCKSLKRLIMSRTFNAKLNAQLIMKPYVPSRTPVE